jgi:hypothetical protein
MNLVKKGFISGKADPRNTGSKRKKIDQNDPDSPRMSSSSTFCG